MAGVGGGGDERWACPQCTFVNLLVASCEMCGQMKDSCGGAGEAEGRGAAEEAAEGSQAEAAYPDLPFQTDGPSTAATDPDAKKASASHSAGEAHPPSQGGAPAPGQAAGGGGEEVSKADVFCVPDFKGACGVAWSGVGWGGIADTTDARTPSPLLTPLLVPIVVIHFRSAGNAPILKQVSTPPLDQNHLIF